ncbi:MAG: hypothetical protein NTV63_05320, partial [Candidatus Woesearchaeota archaeon]|nr:hypothetical protein [Candidatus Woesearchaeota archaeon]
VGSVPSDGWTPFITRITPYQDFPALSNPDIWEVCNKCGSDTCRYCEENYITCQEDIGVGGQCGDSQRIRFTEFAAKNYGVKEGDIVEIPYSGSHCFYVTTPGNPEVNVIAELVYDPYENNPKDEDIKLKCAQNNNGDPGESIVEFKYREGTVIYMAMHIDAQIDNELGKTDFLRNAINSRLPKVSNITITVKESQFIEWNYPGSLEKPANAKLNIKGINDALEKCNSDMCEIKIKINATNGIMLINNLLIEYHLPVYDVKMNVGGNEINIAENLNDSNSPLYLNKSIREGINNYLLSCNEKECIVPFEMEMREKGSIVLSALNVEYQKCLVKEEIIAHTLACWEKSGFGKSGNDISCYEISIPESCGFVEDLKEAEFTDSLKQNGLCEEIGNNGFDEECGKSDSIDFKLMKTAPGRNIFIKYSAEKAKVIII